MRGLRPFLPLLLLPLLLAPLWAEQLGPLREGAKAPLFELAGFNLKEALGKGPVVLVFYRGLF